MGVLSNSLKSGVIGEAIKASSDEQTTVATVIKADESNNICTIEFSRNGKKQRITEAAVDLRNKDWFPEEKELVLIQTSGSNRALILSKYTEDYKKDVRSKQRIKSDISNDGDGTCCGSIF